MPTPESEDKPDTAYTEADFRDGRRLADHIQMQLSADAIAEPYHLLRLSKRECEFLRDALRNFRWPVPELGALIQEIASAQGWAGDDVRWADLWKRIQNAAGQEGTTSAGISASQAEALVPSRVATGSETPAPAAPCALSASGAIEAGLRKAMTSAGFIVGLETDLLDLVNKLVAIRKESGETICRLRGETDYDADLKRFVEYRDHTLHLSSGEFSAVIDFAQGQKARADALASRSTTGDSDKVRATYRGALDRAAYALFQLKRFADMPQAAIDFCREQHSEACRVLDGDGAVSAIGKP